MRYTSAMSTREHLVSILRSRRHWIFDLDGTVYLGRQLLPGALDLVQTLRSRGVGYHFLTNNSSKSSLDYYLRLSGMGIPLDADNVLTSGQATGLWLRAERPEARVFLLGTPALAAELGAAGVQIVEEGADTVVLGYDTTLAYERLAKACHLLRAGATYIATHPDVNCPTPDGPIPDAGAMMALIETSTGRAPERIVGKPSVDILRQAAARANVPLDACVMVGDRLETDMVMALDAGATAIMVLTGVTRPDDPRLATAEWSERLHIVRGVDELHELLTNDDDISS